jgi:predicted component of type VI protein secretion system
VAEMSLKVGSAPGNGMGMAMTKPRLILSTIRQIINQEQERIKSSYRLSQQVIAQISKNPARLSFIDPVR